jgi:hypothetical protein
MRGLVFTETNIRLQFRFSGGWSGRILNSPANCLKR